MMDLLALLKNRLHCSACQSAKKQNVMMDLLTLLRQLCRFRAALKHSQLTLNTKAKHARTIIMSLRSCLLAA